MCVCVSARLFLSIDLSIFLFNIYFNLCLLPFWLVVFFCLELTPESGSIPSSANGNDQSLDRPSTVDLTSGGKRLTESNNDESNPDDKEIQVLKIDDTDSKLNYKEMALRGKRPLKRMETYDSNKKITEQAMDDEFETMSNEFKQTLYNEKARLRKSIDQQIENADMLKKSLNGSVIDTIQNSQSSHLKITNGISASGYDLTQIKDENGRTVLHLAAAKDQKRNIFYKMLQQAKYLLPELDAKYRTIRDVAVQNGIKNNLQVIDQFVIDNYLNEDEEYLKLLMLEGYATLLTVVDSEGNDIISLLKRNNITTMQQFVHEADKLQVIILLNK